MKNITEAIIGVVVLVLIVFFLLFASAAVAGFWGAIAIDIGLSVFDLLR